MQDVIIRANFGSEKIKEFEVYTGGQILGSPIEMAGHPCNSAALLRSLWCTYITLQKLCNFVLSKFRQNSTNFAVQMTKGI